MAGNLLINVQGTKEGSKATPKNLSANGKKETIVNVNAGAKTLPKYKNSLTRQYNESSDELNLGKTVETTPVAETPKVEQTRLEAFNAHKEQAKKEAMGAFTGAFKTWASDIFNFGNTVADLGEEKLGDVDNEFADRWAKQHYGYTGKQVKQKNEKFADDLYAKGSEEIETARKSGGEDNKVMNVATDLVTNATQMGLDIGLGTLTGSAKIPLFMRSAGGAMREAKNDGATTGQQLAYGLTKGSIETLSESLFDGLGGAYGKGLLDSKIARSKVGTAVKNLVGKSPLNQSILKLGSSILSEAGEEGFSSAVDPLAKLIYDGGKSVRDIWNNNDGAREEYINGIGYDALIGGIMGGFGSAGKVFKADTTAYTQLQDMLANNKTLDGAEHFMAMPTAEGADTHPMAEPEKLVDRNTVQSKLNEILAKDSKYSKTAAEIIHNPEALAEYESLYGKIEGNSAEEMQKNLAAALYLTMNQKQVNMPQPTEDFQKVAYPEETKARENPMAMSEPTLTAEQSYMRGMIMNGDVEGIVSSPQTVTLYEQMTGTHLPRNADGLIDVKKAQGQIAQVSRNLYSGDTELTQRILTENENTPNINAETTTTETQQITPQAEQNATQAVKPAENTQQTETTQNIVAEPTQPSQVADVETSKTIYESMPGQPAQVKERGFSENIRTDSNMPEEIRARYANDPAVYEVAGNKETLGKALDIMANGVPNATEYIEMRLADAKENNKKLKPEDVPLARMIATELYKTEGKTADQISLDKQRANNILDRVAEELTWAGQFGQAARILRDADPSLQMRNMVNAVKILNEKYAKNNAKRGSEITIPQELVEKYQAQDTAEGRNAVIDEMQESVATQCGHTLSGMFTSLRYLNMLGNFKTQGRNLVGNLGMLVERNIKDTVGALMEAGLKPTERTKSLIRGNAILRTGEYKAAMSDFKNDPMLQKAAMGEAKYGDTQNSSTNSMVNAIESKKKPFSENGLLGMTVGKTLNAYNRATSWAMEMGDQIFVAENYAETLAGYMRANGVTAEQWTEMVKNNDPFVDKARNYAIKQAQESTFRDTNAVSKAVSGFDKNWSNAAKKVTQGIMPFRKTPANVLVRMEEYSPLGLVNAIVKGIQAKKGVNNVTGTDVIESLSKALTGTGLAYVGYALATAGKARTKNADEEKEAFEKNIGLQDYSITIGDRNITADWLTPEATAFFMGVALSELQKDGLSGDAALKILGQVTDPMLEMSMMSGINDTLDQLANADDINSIGQLVINSMLNYLGQGISNTLLGQLEQGSEKYRQTYYTEKDSVVPTGVQKWIAKTSNKTPGIDVSTADYIDAWGEKQAGAGYVNALFNPAYVANVANDKLNTELIKLYDSLKNTDFEGTVLPATVSRSTSVDNVRLSPAEYERYATSKGKKSKELIEEFINSDAYQNMDNAMRGEVIKELYSKATDFAKDAVQIMRRDERNTDYYKLIKGVEQNGEDKSALNLHNMVDYTVLNTLANKAINDKDAAAIDNAVAMYNNGNDNLKTIVEERMPGLTPYIKASKAGIGADSWIKYKSSLENIKTLEDTASDGSRLKYKAIVDSGLSLKEQQKLIDMDDEISKNWKMADEVLSDKGFSKQEIYDFFSNADWTYSNKTEEYEANGQLGAYEAYVALQKLIPDDRNLRKEIFNSFVEATGDPGRYDGWSRNTSKNTWKKYDYDYCERVIKRYGDKSYGSANKSTKLTKNSLTSVQGKKESK